MLYIVGGQSNVGDDVVDLNIFYAVSYIDGILKINSLPTLPVKSHSMAVCCQGNMLFATCGV